MIEIRRMTIDDVLLGLKLTRQAGWNQTESDWLRFMNLEPTGCFVAELNGSSVATITTCLFGQVAWIAMLLVDAGARGRGVGTAMLKHSLNYLEGRKVKTVRLDATSAGQPIYEKLGFVPEYQLARFACRDLASPPAATRCVKSHRGESEPRREGMAPSGRTGPVVTEATPEIFAGIIEFDKRMTGTNRAKMLSRLFEEFPEDIHALWHGDKVEGFIITRPGANAIQIGPCIAATDAGSALLADALDRCAAESVFIDIPLDNAEAVRVAESGTLRIQRYFMRMYRGERVKDNIKALWASSGPEKE